MTYEETAKALRLCASDDENACQKCPRQTICNEDKNMGGLFIDSASAIEELLKVAKAMHTWIFLNTVDEKAVYDKCGLTPEMNAAFGYDGPYTADDIKPYDILYEEGGPST